MGENDQQWIYDNYTCQASNAIGTARFSIELRRARAYVHFYQDYGTCFVLRPTAVENFN